MRYEGDIYRPPSEAYSYILQVTIGCAHNKCTFCGSFKAKKFRMRHLDEIFEDLEMARRYYRRVGRIFLADGDALVCEVGVAARADFAEQLDGAHDAGGVGPG